MTLQWSRVVSGLCAIALVSALSGCGGPRRACVYPCREPLTDHGVILDDSAKTALTEPMPSPSPSSSLEVAAGYADLSYTDPDTGAAANYAVRMQSDGLGHYWATADQIPENALRASNAVMELTLYGLGGPTPIIVAMSLAIAQPAN